MRILITGGAGFVGSALASYFRRRHHEVSVFDNLRRRGSEWNIARLQGEGIEFIHGDVRNPADLDAIDGNFDALIEASAEPSVHAGMGGSPRYVLDTNLLGAVNCLEFARLRCAGVVFISSSRVYSIEPLVNLPLLELPTRLDLGSDQPAGGGLSFAGISEDFACDRYRSYYGASKLAAELVCQEYARQAPLPVVINRCGVIAGPGQFGKTDQGVFTLWVARHHFGRPLRYTGFGGTGLQVRDLLHPEDLCELIEAQLAALPALSGRTFNVGGGRAGSVSLQEFTRLCQETAGREVAISSDPATSDVDIPWYVTDHAKVTAELAWAPKRGPRQIVEDIHAWVRANEGSLSAFIQ